MARMEGFRPRMGHSCWAPVQVGESEGTLGMGGFAVGGWGTHSLLTGRVPGFGPQALREAFRQVPLPPPPPPRAVEGAHPSCAPCWIRERQPSVAGMVKSPGLPARSGDCLPCGCLREEGKSSEKGREPGPHH